MEIALFYLTDDGLLGQRHGGSISFTCHLYHALCIGGHKPRLIRITQRSEKKYRSFRPQVPYQNLSLRAAVRFAEQVPSLITFSIWKQYEPEICALLSAGSGIVVHDPAEFYPAFFEEIADAGIRPAMIRKANRRALREAGLYPIFLPHPYVSTPSPTKPLRKRSKHAISLSRVDFRKHIDIIIEANELLDEDRRIDIAGDENRRYTHFDLDVKHKGWRAKYLGSFPSGLWSAVTLASGYRYVVDMTEIKGDGGGTQYTFFEAWNAGCILVLNKAWLCKTSNVLKPGIDAFFVEDGEELAELLSRPMPECLEIGEYKLLAKHSPEAVVPKVLKYLERRKIGG